MMLNYNKKQFFIIAILSLSSYLSFGQFYSADLHSEVTQVQPMTGIVFWSENSGDLNQLGNKVQLEFSYLVYSDVIQNAGAYNWNIVDNLLAGAASSGRQMIIRFRYTYPGVTNPSVPNYIRNSNGYEDQTLSVEGRSTYIPDWSSQALRDFTKEFYTKFSERYDNDSRLAFLQIGFGSYSEYHLYDGPLNLGQTFPSKAYQTEFLNHVNQVFQETQWGISIDAASSSRTPIASDNLQSLNYGLFDDSFVHETHSQNNNEYNRASWLFFGANKYETNAAGGELSYFDGEQPKVLNPDGTNGTSFEELSARYNISYMIGNDQLNYQSVSRIESAGRAIGYRFSVERYETDGTITRVTIKNNGIAPIYYDAYPSIGGVRSNSSLKGLLPTQAREFIISRAAAGEDLKIECDRLSPGQEIQFNADIEGGNNQCDGNLANTPCNDDDDCTIGETYDANCNCVGGIYTDADQDGICVGNDPNDNDPCNPVACNGNNCITIDGNLSDWSDINNLASNAGFTLKAADDNTALYIHVNGNIGESGQGYQIFIDTDNNGSGFTYYSSWSQTGFDAMIENGSFSSYEGSGSDWTWSSETPVINSKTTAGIELKIDKSLLNANQSAIRIGFAALNNWEGAAFVPAGNNASSYTLSSSLNCGDSCPDADGDGVCNADDICPAGDDNVDTDGDGTPDACDNCNQQGQLCNDDDDCTTGETYDANCNCRGGIFQDRDNDGVCDTNDICPAGDDNVDSDGDGTPDACDNCNQQGQLCNDEDDCTTGERYDANCNCIGGIYTDADQDGVCAGNDPNDNDPCNPVACNGNDCITIDGNLSDWSDVGNLASNAGYTLKTADDNTALYIHVSGNIGEDGQGYQIFLDTDNSGSEFTYYTSWSQTGFDAMIENGSFSSYEGSGNDWLWSSETPVFNSKTTAGIELKIDKSLLNANQSAIRIGFASLNNWEGAAFVPTGNNASSYTLSSSLNCGDSCPDADGDGVCNADDICPAGDDNMDTDGDGTPNACDNCNQQGQLCDDFDDCTTGETYDANCNCRGGTYTDADNDGVCTGNDPNDNDPCSPVACNNSCNVFDESNFDSGWGIWNDGGSDVRRSRNDAAYANSGSYCVRLRDNSNRASSMYTDALDLSAVTSVNISFSFIAISMENNEDFFLEISTDGGSSYTLLEEWNANDEFVNGTRYYETFSMTMSDENFTDNTVFRFRCDASANGDRVYIDDVVIEACGGAISPARLGVKSTSSAVNLYPNPANQSIQLDYKMPENAETQIGIYDAFGKLLKQIINVEPVTGAPTEVEVSQFPAGVYFCTLQFGESKIVKKFIIAR